MTDEEKRLIVEAMRLSNRVVMDVVCPPGMLLLCAATWIVTIPGLLWLYWATGWFG